MTNPRRPRGRRARPRLGATLTLLLASGVTACGSDASDPEPYEAVADLHEMMAHVLEPSAQVYWGSVGWILDAEGEHELRPETDEEWIAVENAAFIVAESGNLLMMADRAVDDDAWMVMSKALVDIGRRAVEVAEARDEQAVFDVGAEMYFVCTQCHATYAVETLRPSDDRSESEGDGEGRP